MRGSAWQTDELFPIMAMGTIVIPELSHTEGSLPGQTSSLVGARFRNVPLPGSFLLHCFTTERPEGLLAASLRMQIQGQSKLLPL